MNIAKLHYISQGQTPEEHLHNIQKACTYGAELVQLRLKNTDEKTILKTAEKAREITAHFQTRLIINDHYKIAKAIHADGVHLGKTDACPLEAREYLGKWFIIGGTANTIEDCQNLLSQNVNYIGLGPFRFTNTKENLSPVLGLEGFHSILEDLQSETPIIAIGGIVEQDIPALLQTGIHGIAMSGAITENFNSISTINKLLNASATFEQRHTL
ncbi:thiamine phosphate synthase [Aestuariibaculum suncheonense]|uniref:Thiamine-phosphate synthase n=1 Tax=Aestuariibaculum suncheonense TaxID=1028745 RepID=A0A8J6QAR1_9FLAO|nr:thiamine phosphate synthase [Aestuariibaculum suncheonense]MBD0836734.1 thiamine phosphate synthase [Aestuariibaculum suncheonense]